MKIGFIGLGRMGYPMAQKLIQGAHALTVHNRSPESVQKLVAQGATAASNAADVAKNVDFLITCLLHVEQVEEIYLGKNGAISQAREGQIYIDTSTVDPMTSRKIATALAAKGVSFLDAPISGGPKGAQEGTLSIMVGGDKPVLDRARPILELFGKKIFHMGPVGSGVSTKICNQTLTATTQALVAETMVLGTKLGLDPQQLFDVLKVSTGQSNALERVVPNFILPRNFNAAYSIDGIIKDLECAIKAAKANDVRLLLPTIAQQLYQEARGLGHSQKDVGAVVLAMEAIAGVKVERKQP